MTTLELLQEAQKNKRGSSKASKKRSVQKNEDLIDLFPLPRYLQAHFQHIHNNNTENNQSDLVQLKNHLAKIEVKLDRLLALFVSSTKQMY